MISEKLCLIQSDIDDDTAENLAAFMELALTNGANDCVLIPVVMKKNRPGTRVEILCKPEEVEYFGELLLQETMSVGYRKIDVIRNCFERKFISINLEGVEIKVKVVMDKEKVVRWKPEHDDCQKASTVLGISLRETKNRAYEIAQNKLFDQS